MSDFLKCSSLGNWNRSWILKSTPVLAKLFTRHGKNQDRTISDHRPDHGSDHVQNIHFSIHDPIRDPVHDLVHDPVRDPVRDPVYDLVREPVRDPIRPGADFVDAVFAWRHVQIPILSHSTGIFCSSSWNEYFIVALWYFCIHASKKFFLNVHLVFYLNSTMTLANDVETSSFFRLNLYVFKAFAFLLCFIAKSPLIFFLYPKKLRFRFVLFHSVLHCGPFD